MLSRGALVRLAASPATFETHRSLHGPHGGAALLHLHNRLASSASSTRWKTRQSSDHFAREAKVQGLKSRAAFKLLQVQPLLDGGKVSKLYLKYVQINEKYKLFKRGITVVDLVRLN